MKELVTSLTVFVMFSIAHAQTQKTTYQPSPRGTLNFCAPYINGTTSDPELIAAVAPRLADGTLLSQSVFIWFLSKFKTQVEGTIRSIADSMTPYWGGKESAPKMRNDQSWEKTFGYVYSLLESAGIRSDTKNYEEDRWRVDGGPDSLAPPPKSMLHTYIEQAVDALRASESQIKSGSYAASAFLMNSEKVEVKTNGIQPSGQLQIEAKLSKNGNELIGGTTGGVMLLSSRQMVLFPLLLLEAIKGADTFTLSNVRPDNTALFSVVIKGGPYAGKRGLAFNLDTKQWRFLDESPGNTDWGAFHGSTFLPTGAWGGPTAPLKIADYKTGKVTVVRSHERDSQNKFFKRIGHLARGVYTDYWKDELVVRDIKHGSVRFRTRIPVAQARDGVFSGDGNFLAVPYQTDMERTYEIALFDTRTGRRIGTLTNFPAIATPTYLAPAIAFAETGARMATVDHNGDLTVWDLYTKQRLWTAPRALKTGINDDRIKFSADGKRLLISWHYRVVAYDVDSKTLLFETTVPENGQNYFGGAEISDDGKSFVAYVYTGSPMTDSRVIRWEIP
jgi:hypothetical protein